MQNQKIVLILAVFLVFPSFSKAVPASWFKNIECQELTINKYVSASYKGMNAETVIKDKFYIADVRARISSLPTVGKEVVKPGPNTKRINLSFRCAEGVYETVEFIGNKIKTPSEGFLDKKNKVEVNLFRDIDALVEPDLDKRIPKVADQSIRFKGFTLIYAGEKKTPQDPKGPTIGSTSETSFSVWEKDSANQVKLVIFSGQIPPQPQAFVSGNKILYLLTYQSANKESLYDQYFEVSSKIPKR